MRHKKSQTRSTVESAQAMVEYALIVVLLILAFGVALAATGPYVGNVFCEVALNLVENDAPSDYSAVYEPGENATSGKCAYENRETSYLDENRMPDAEEFWQTVTVVASLTAEDRSLPTSTRAPITPTPLTVDTPSPTPITPTATEIPSETPVPSPTEEDHRHVAPWEDSAEKPIDWRLDDSFYTGSEDWFGIYYDNRSMTAPAKSALYNNEIDEAFRNKLNFDWGTGAAIADLSDTNNWSVSFRKPIWIQESATNGTGMVTLSIDIPRVEDGIRIWIVGEQFGGEVNVETGSAGSCSGLGVTPGGLGEDVSTAGAGWNIYDDAYFGFNPATDPAAAAPTECLLVDRWKHGGAPASQLSVKRSVPAGFYMLQVDYYDEQGDASIAVNVGSTSTQINPDDTTVDTAGNDLGGVPTCGWYNRESNKLPNTLDYMWDEFEDGANLPAGSRCYLELRGWVEIPATMTNVKLTFWDIWEMQTGVYGWLEIGDYDAYAATNPRDRSALSWQRVNLHEGMTYNYNWTHHTVGMDSYVGKKVALRFVIENRSSADINRWYIDNIRIASTPRQTFYMSQQWDLNNNAQRNDFITSGHWAMTNENALGAGMAWHESPGRNTSAFTEYHQRDVTLPPDYNDTRIHSIEFNGVVDVNDPNGLSDLEGDVGDPLLTFWHKYDIGTLTQLEIQYTTDGLTTDPNTSFGVQAPVWHTVPDTGVLVAGNTTGSANNQMEFVEIPLQPIVDAIGSSRFRLRFALIMRWDASEDNGWWIDEIQLERVGTEKFLPYPFFDNVDTVETVRNWEGDWGRVEGGRNPEAGAGYSYTDSPYTSYGNNKTYNLITSETFDTFMDSPQNVRSAACELGGACETPDPTPVAPMLEFYWWRDVNPSDHLYVEWRRRSEADTAWRILWAYKAEMRTNGTGTDYETRIQLDWERVEVNLKPMMDILKAQDNPADPLDDDIILRFSFRTNGSGTRDGHYVDDIRVRERNTNIWRLWPTGTTPTTVSGTALPAGSGIVYYDGIEGTGNPASNYWHIGGSWTAINWDSKGGVTSFHDSPVGQSAPPPFMDGSNITNYATKADTYNVLELGTWIDLRGVDAASVPMLSFWSHYAVGTDDRARVEISLLEQNRYDNPASSSYCQDGYAQCYEKNYGWSEWIGLWDRSSQKRTYTWQYERIDLSAYAKNGSSDGQIIRIRFVLDALRNSNTWDGWYIDEVRVQYNQPRVYVINRDNSIYDSSRNMRNWIAEGKWGLSTTFGRGQSPTSGMGQLIWSYEYVNLRNTSIRTKCEPNSGDHIQCATHYFDNNPLPITSSSGSHIGQETSVNYPDAEFHQDYADLSESYLGARWITTTGLVGPSTSGGIIEPGLYFFQTISDDGVRMRYEVASGSCTLPSTPTTDMPLAGQTWNLINNWNGHGDTTDTGRAQLESGCTYRFELQWFQGTGGKTIVLSQGTSGNMSFTDTPAYGPDENQDIAAVPRSNSSLLLNGVLDLTGADDPVVQYYTYHELGGTAYVEVSPDGGFTWTQQGLQGGPPPSDIWTSAWTVDLFNDNANRENKMQAAPSYVGVAAGTDAGIHLNFGNDYIGKLFPEVPDNWGQDYASMRFTRTFTLAQDTTFLFQTNGDDGLRLWVDYDASDPKCTALATSGGPDSGSSKTYPSPQYTGDCLIIDNWKRQGTNPLSVLRTIEAGTHTLQLDYFEETSGAYIDLDVIKTNNGIPFDAPTYSGVNMPNTPAEIPSNWISKAHDLTIYAGADMPFISLRFRLDRMDVKGVDENRNPQSRNQSPFNFKESWWITDITIAEP
ncbi:hypothetical protein G4Y79_17715 [Phototrophicus methaneseepsis]|uniref:PA14 domain-containing protein n=1 Tax=Phototrophicus methaneseepsis TaxID=2710758 RepID=A0A7S8E713_9CHLR|nr:hypothetical protein [Phototrophicus methaneseepsis]QPC81514.1 hypothetical protein G4Y79_17715 [Phototrophicus methaneseepsis]